LAPFYDGIDEVTTFVDATQLTATSVDGRKIASADVTDRLKTGQ